MEWTDTALVLSLRRHGESGTIAMLLTRDHGRHAGLLRGQRQAAVLQPGTPVQARWRARLADHLGSFTLEAERSPAAGVLDDPLRLGALAAACALAEGSLPERAAVPGVHDGLRALLAALGSEHWDAVYVQWELGLLAALGFGLELDRCAATGANDALAFVSPRTGRAVSLSAGEPYADKLLPLPGFLIGRGAADPPAVLQGLELTGYFIERLLFAQAHQPVPPARTRHVERYRKFATTSGSLPA